MINHPPACYFTIFHNDILTSLDQFNHPPEPFMVSSGSATVMIISSEGLLQTEPSGPLMVYHILFVWFFFILDVMHFFFYLCRTRVSQFEKNLRS